MKIFITGGGGLLGSALSFELIKKHKVILGYHFNRIDIKNTNFSFEQIDITKIESLKLIKKISPDVIIHAAALTDLEFCEKNPKLAHEVNVKGTKNVSNIAKKCGAKIVYICTDYVFDGRKGNYSERDKPNPLSIYAKTKLEGEGQIMKSHDEFISVRTSLHGWNPNPEKSSLSSWVINSLKNKEEIFLVTDQFNSLMFTSELAKTLIEMVGRGLIGIFNVASSNNMSRYNFALNIADVFDLDQDLIKPISYQSFIEKFSLLASRPQNVSLNVSKIESELGREMPTISAGIFFMKEKETEFKKNVRWIE